MFSVFHPMGLHFGDHTPSTRGRATPNRGNCIIRAATRRRYTVSQLLMLQNPHHHRHGERPGHGKPGRDAREQRQGAAIARQQPRRAASVQNSPCTPAFTACPGQNSPSTSSTAPLPVQNSPRTPDLTACPGQNSPSTPKMAQFGAIYACRESFVPLSPPRSQAGRVLYRTQGRVGASHDTTTGTTSAEGTGGTTGTRRMTGGLRQDHRQTNFACNSPTARSNTSSKTAEYQRSDFKT